MRALGRAFIRLLDWLRITDENRVLSLTHGFLVLACVVYWRHPDAITAATAAAAVANYSAKHIMRRREVKAEPQGPSPEVKELSRQVQALAAELQGFRTASTYANLRK